MKPNNTSQEIWEALKLSQKPLCILDSRFDFDSMCSALVMRLVLKRVLGKNLTLKCEYESFPQSVRDLKIDNSVIDYSIDPKSVDLSKYDLLITLDTGNLNHLSKATDFVLPTPIKILNIDHHAVNKHYGDLNYVSVVAATSSQLFKLFSEMTQPLEKEELYLLAVALIVDSGFFCFNNVRAEDFEMAACIIRNGIDIYDIVQTLTFNISYETFQLRKIVYSNMTLLPEDKVIWSYITEKEMKDNNISAELNNQPPADMLKQLAGIDYAFVVRETPGEKNMWNVSIRSHNRAFSSKLLAAEFGGGGHDMAAGCNVRYDGDINQVARIIIDKAKEMKAAGKLFN